jgi:hypothetical protein
MPINLAEHEFAGQCREAAPHAQKRNRPNYFGTAWKERPNRVLLRRSASAP